MMKTKIIGKVVHGAKRGKKLGFPTANMEPSDKNFTLPRHGVYASLVEIDSKTYQAITNIGPAKTFGVKEATIEPHILDFDKDIYGKTITVKLIQYLRGMKKFTGPEELSRQLKRDYYKARDILRNNNKSNVKLEPIESLSHNKQNIIVEILNNDNKLQKALGSRQKTSTKDFIKTNKEWSKKNNANIYAIFTHSEPIGLISLTNIDNNNDSKVGYWLKSDCWNKGITAKAFDLIVDIAKDNKIKSLTCSIPKTCTASLAIWKKKKAQITEDGDYFIPRINL